MKSSAIKHGQTAFLRVRVVQGPLPHHPAERYLCHVLSKDGQALAQIQVGGRDVSMPIIVPAAALVEGATC